MSDIQDKLHAAKRAKKDEFYTQMGTIEKELFHYRHHFENKTVFLNCDDPEYSNFWKYFSLNFDFFKLKRLISTHYKEEKPSYMLEMRIEDGNIIMERKELEENGFSASLHSDLWISTFHSFCIRLLKKYSIEAGLAPSFKIADEKQLEELYANIVKRIKYNESHTIENFEEIC